MNNKGFAITAMLYGTVLAFLMLMGVMLSILHSFHSNMDKLVDGSNGARKIAELKCSDYVQDTDGDGFYVFDERKDTSLTDAQFKNILSWCGYKSS